MNTTSRVRFQALVRDGFRCRYCGAGPKDARLTIDHIVPVSKRGHSDVENLVTACIDCNFGKSDGHVDFVPEGVEAEFEFEDPVDAPAAVVEQVESESMALQVMLRAAGLPQFAVADMCGISHAYMSKLQSGKRSIPHKLVAPLCAATGSNLLAQFIRLERAMSGVCEVTRLAEMMREAA